MKTGPIHQLNDFSSSGDAIESEMCNTRACTGSLSWTSDGQKIGVCIAYILANTIV